MKYIVTYPTPFYSKSSTLEGKTYNFYFHWEIRQGVWLMDLSDSQGNPIVQSQKLLFGTPLLQHVRTLSNCPPGDLIVVSLDGTDNPPALADMDYANGGRCRLIYLTGANLASLAAGVSFAQLGNDG
jgi:hypothetical protein